MERRRRPTQFRELVKANTTFLDFRLFGYSLNAARMGLFQEDAFILDFSKENDLARNISRDDEISVVVEV